MSVGIQKWKVLWGGVAFPDVYQYISQIYTCLFVPIVSKQISAYLPLNGVSGVKIGVFGGAKHNWTIVTCLAHAFHVYTHVKSFF